MRYTVRAKGSDEVVASSPEPGAEFTLGNGHCLKVGLTPAPMHCLWRASMCGKSLNVRRNACPHSDIGVLYKMFMLPCVLSMP